MTSVHSSPWTRARPARGPSCSIGTAGSRESRNASSDRFFRSQAGSSMTRWRSGRRRPASPWRCWRGAGVRARDVAAIGITNQRETTIVWDREDRRARSPTPSSGRIGARRTSAIACDAEGAEPLFRERTGLVLDAYFSGTKLAWILDNVDGARARAEAGELAFGTVDSLAALEAHRRPAAHHRRQQRVAHAAVQHPHAALGRRAAARCCDVPRSVLPDVRASSEVYGEVTATLGARVCRTRRHRRRSAGGAVRPDVHVARADEEHLRHRLLHAAEHRRRRRLASQHKLLTTVAWMRNGDDRIRARRQRLHRRRRRAVAPRRPWHHPILERTSRRWRCRCPTTAASISCRRSPALARRIGTSTPAARSSG